MKAESLHRTAVLHSVLATCLLMLIAGCDRLIDHGSGGCTGQAATGAGCSGAGNDFTIVFTSEERTSGMLFSIGGAIEDDGRVQGDGMRAELMPAWPKEWKGTRGLVGEKGVLVVAFEGQNIPSERGALKGRFTILNAGMGAYAGLRGNGTFVVDFDAGGRQIEVFTGTFLP